jgi:hypothetical protein
MLFKTPVLWRFGKAKCIQKRHRSAAVQNANEPHAGAHLFKLAQAHSSLFKAIQPHSRGFWKKRIVYFSADHPPANSGLFVPGTAFSIQCWTLVVRCSLELGRWLFPFFSLYAMRGFPPVKIFPGAFSHLELSLFSAIIPV